MCANSVAQILEAGSWGEGKQRPLAPRGASRNWIGAISALDHFCLWLSAVLSGQVFEDGLCDSRGYSCSLLHGPCVWTQGESGRRILTSSLMRKHLSEKNTPHVKALGRLEAFLLTGPSCRQLLFRTPSCYPQPLFSLTQQGFVLDGCIEVQNDNRLYYFLSTW